MLADALKAELSARSDPDYRLCVTTESDGTTWVEYWAPGGWLVHRDLDWYVGKYLARHAR